MSISRHGMTGTRLQRIYHNMKQRCLNPKDPAYKNYGGRGIKICEEWKQKHGFYYFMKWALSNGYSDLLTLDRIDVNGDYCPENCRWVDFYTQQKNRRNSRYVSENGDVKYLLEAAKEHNIPYHRLKDRVDRNWNKKDYYKETPKPRKIPYKGKEYTIKELSEVTGIPYNTLQTRYTKGFSDEEMVAPVLSLQFRAVCQYSLQGDFIAEYESVIKASKSSGVNRSGISMCCSHQRKSAGGYIWEYKDIFKSERHKRN